MKNKNIQADRERTRAAAAHLFCWCLVVALHQGEGIGGKRLDRLSASIERREKEISREIITMGKRAAVAAAGQKLLAEVPGVETDIRLPLNRAPRTRDEQQKIMAGNEAITMTWFIWALGLHDGLGFGAARLNRVRQAALDNYRQFGEWKAEDGEDVAFDRLRRCVQDALKEKVAVIEEQPARGVAHNEPAFTKDETTAVVCAVAKRHRAAAGGQPVPVAVLSQKEMERRVGAITAGR